MSSAMPVEARKKPNSTATTTGPALIVPPRINTTRTIPNSSTTDSEMATTDHTLRSVRSPGPRVPPRTPPQNHRATNRPRLCGRWGIIGHRSRRTCTIRTPAALPRGHERRGRVRQFEESPARRIQEGHCRAHTSCSQMIRIVAAGTVSGWRSGRRERQQTPINGHFTRVARKCYAPFSRDEGGRNWRTCHISRPLHHQVGFVACLSRACPTLVTRFFKSLILPGISEG